MKCQLPRKIQLRAILLQLNTLAITYCKEYKVGFFLKKGRESNKTYLISTASGMKQKLFLKTHNLYSSNIKGHAPQNISIFFNNFFLLLKSKRNEPMSMNNVNCSKWISIWLYFGYRKKWLLFCVLSQYFCYVVLKALIEKWDNVNQARVYSEIT